MVRRRMSDAAVVTVLLHICYWVYSVLNYCASDNWNRTERCVVMLRSWSVGRYSSRFTGFHTRISPPISRGTSWLLVRHLVLRYGEGEYLFLGLSESRITPKMINEFSWNFRGLFPLNKKESIRFYMVRNQLWRKSYISMHYGLRSIVSHFPVIRLFCTGLYYRIASPCWSVLG